MKRVRTSRWCGSILLASFALLMAPAAVGAQMSTTITQDTARLLVTVELKLPEGRTFQATAWEGDALVFRSESLGVHLALVPRVEDRLTGDVIVEVFPLTDASGRTEVIAEPSKLEARIGYQVYLASLIDIEILEARQPTLAERLDFVDRKAARIDLAEGVVVVQTSGCCVSCGTDSFCGCKVVASCGTCCDGCCGGRLAK